MFILDYFLDNAILPCFYSLVCLSSLPELISSEKLCHIFIDQKNMAKKLFVGNLDWGMTQEELQELFAEYGEIEEAIIITDKFSGRSKGFGFVTFTDDAAADAATEALHEKEFKGRNIVVNEARPKEER